MILEIKQMIREKLEWDYYLTLEEGIRKTYNWIHRQITLAEINEEILEPSIPERY